MGGGISSRSHWSLSALNLRTGKSHGQLYTEVGSNDQVEAQKKFWRSSTTLLDVSFESEQSASRMDTPSTPKYYIYTHAYLGSHRIVDLLRLHRSPES